MVGLGDAEGRTLRSSQILQEIRWQMDATPSSTDIILVVHNQLPFVKRCVETIVVNTKNFTLWVHDNDSDDETRAYLAGMASEHGFQVFRSLTNEGFIKPCNALAALGDSGYLIVVNSDIEVARGWDQAMVGCLQANPHVAQVGYQGAVLGEDARGVSMADGKQPDYICGWCFCISRETYERSGLFDEENLKFAYGEDSDLSLRLKEQGKGIIALAVQYVFHHGNQTIKAVVKDLKWAASLRESFDANHAYLRRRWISYLAHERVLLQDQPAHL